MAAVGKKYVTKVVIASAKLTYHTMADYGDHHSEAKWYDYDEEVKEPKAPQESLIGLKVYQKAPPLFGLNYLDSDFDLSQPTRLGNSMKKSQRGSVISSRTRIKS